MPLKNVGVSGKKEGTLVEAVVGSVEDLSS
jgi:hypothetical protein